MICLNRSIVSFKYFIIRIRYYGITVFLFGYFNHIAYSIGVKGVVRIQKENIFTVCRIDSRISCRRKTTVFFMYNNNSIIAFLKIITYLRAAVRRTVIDDNNLRIFTILRLTRISTFNNIFFGSIYRNNRAYERFH